MPVPPGSPYYESDRAVAEYLLFHFGTPDQRMPWPEGPRDARGFPGRCADLALATHRPQRLERALDLGCAVGGASFELARIVPEVIGIDRSHAFINTARRLLQEGAVSYPVAVEGSLVKTARAQPPAPPPGHRIHFGVGDALEADANLGTFDLVLAANLLDRVPDPRRLLERLPPLVRPGGTLVLTSPYTWLEEYTPASAWLTASGRPSAEALPDLLPGFRRIARQDIAFVLREHTRKYQWSVAEATAWRRS